MVGAVVGDEVGALVGEEVRAMKGEGDTETLPVPRDSRARESPIDPSLSPTSAVPPLPRPPANALPQH